MSEKSLYVIETAPLPDVAEMSNPESGDASPTKPRTTVQAALQITIEDCIPNAREFSRGSGVPSPTLSEFKNNKRSINLTTLQLILDALDAEQYAYFLEVLIKGDMLLSKRIVDWAEDSNVRSADPITLKRSFHALVASYCSQCNREEQLELLAVIHRASVQNARLLGESD